MSVISVLVPIYNSEKYLRTCIDSILNQTFCDFELVLVDDGSTDASGKICDEYAQKDERVRVIHKSNQGVGMARNTALDNAKSDYVVMIDSDDCINCNYLQTLFDFINRENADIVFSAGYGFVEDIEIKNIINTSQNITGLEVMTQSEFMEKICGGGYYLVG